MTLIPRQGGGSDCIWILYQHLLFSLWQHTTCHCRCHCPCSVGGKEWSCEAARAEGNSLDSEGKGLGLHCSETAHKTGQPKAPRAQWHLSGSPPLPGAHVIDGPFMSIVHECVCWAQKSCCESYLVFTKWCPYVDLIKWSSGRTNSNGGHSQPPFAACRQLSKPMSLLPPFPPLHQLLLYLGSSRKRKIIYRQSNCESKDYCFSVQLLLFGVAGNTVRIILRAKMKFN